MTISPRDSQILEKEPTTLMPLIFNENKGLMAAVLLTAVVLFLSPSQAYADDAKVRLFEDTRFPIISDGKEIGAAVLKKGTAVEIIRREGARVLVKSAMGEAWIPSGMIISESSESNSFLSSTGIAEPTPANSLPDEGKVPSPAIPPMGGTGVQGNANDTTVKPTQDARITIHALNSDIPVLRVGSGPRGIVVFSHTGELAKDIEDNIEAYAPLLKDRWSIFLFSYPKSMFDRIGSSADDRPDFSGFATEVVAALRKATQVREYCLIGNSMGGGVILWDIDSLAKNPDLSFILVSPTPQFCPPVLERTKKYPRMAILAVDEDPFIGPLPALFLKNQSPFSKDFKGRGHLIVGDNLSHEEFVQLIQKLSRSR